jgi:hypothetical protein
LLKLKKTDSNFLALALAGSSFGSALSEFFIPIYMYKITGDPFLMALQLFFSFLGNIAAAQFVITNKYTANDKITCMLIDSIACIAMISATQVTPSVLPFYLYFVSFITALMGTASKGYYESLIGSISESSKAENRQVIASKTKTAENLGSLAGYASAAFILAATSYKVAFFIDALTYGLSIFFLSKMSSSGIEIKSKEIKKTPTILSILFSSRIKFLSISHGLAGVGLSTFSASSIFILKDYFKSPDNLISIFYISQFAANVFGASLSYYITQRIELTEHEGWKIRLLYALPLVSAWFLSNGISFIVFFAFFSAVHSFSIPMFLSFFQKGVERNNWKIVGASRKTLVSVVGMITSLVCGSLLKFMSFKLIYLFAGGFIFISAFFLFLHSKLRNNSNE